MKKPAPKKQTSKRLATLGGRYRRIKMEELYNLDPAILLRDVHSLGACVESQYEVPNPKKKTKSV